jgi:hypothetical protein
MDEKYIWRHSMHDLWYNNRKLGNAPILRTNIVAFQFLRLLSGYKYNCMYIHRLLEYTPVLYVSQEVNIVHFRRRCRDLPAMPSKNENGTEISRTEPYRFLYFIRSNSYFCVWLYRFRFRFRISNVKVENGLDIFRPFPTVFYFSTFNSEYPEFKIQFKPNFVVNHYCLGN